MMSRGFSPFKQQCKIKTKIRVVTGPKGSWPFASGRSARNSIAYLFDSPQTEYLIQEQGFYSHLVNGSIICFIRKRVSSYKGLQFMTSSSVFFSLNSDFWNTSNLILFHFHTNKLLGPKTSYWGVITVLTQPQRYSKMLLPKVGFLGLVCNVKLN